MKKVSRQKFIKACATLMAGSGVLAACGSDTSSVPIASTTAPATATPAPTNATITKAVTLASTPAPVTTAVPTTSTAPPTTTPAPTTQPSLTTTTSATTTQAANPGIKVSDLDLAAKVGQRMLVVFPGTTLTPAISRFLLTVKPGGIVMFAANIGSLDGIKKLNRDLQTLAAQNGLPPFILTLDEEGGIVSRMPASARESIAPSQMAQAAAGSGAVADCARETAIRLANLGFNLNLAPVADVNSNHENPVIGTRSYGSQPRVVAQHIRAALSEYEAQGVGACVKHFPGHGDTNVDSHSGLPVVRKSRAELNQTELVPFVEAIAAGTPAIMTAHILFPQIEPNGLPATLSPVFLKQILRTELKYEGLIITDSLSMGAISNKYGLAEAGRLALRAGADQIIAIGDLEAQTAVFNTLLAAARRNEFELDRPVERILAFKATYAQSRPNRPENSTSFATVAQASITALRSDGKSLPIRAKKLLLVNFALAKPSQVEGQPPGTLLGELWREKFPAQPILEVSTTPVAAETQRALAAARAADLVVIITRDAYDNAPQANLVKMLLELATPAVVVAVRGPYDLLAFPKADNYLVTYSDTSASQRALVAALSGATPFTFKGRLPVAIPGLFEAGAGL